MVASIGQRHCSVAAHARLSIQIHEHGERLLRRVDDLKNLLINMHTLARQEPKRWTPFILEACANTSVCISAELESLIRESIKASHTEINKSGIPVCDLRSSLRGLAYHSVFESLRSTQKADIVWGHRLTVTSLEQCRIPARLPIQAPQPPLDGKTIKPEALNLIWEVYGLPEQAFPFSSWAASLQKISLIRNDVAHGEMEFRHIFNQAGRSPQDIERYIDDISSLSIHFVSNWSNYMTNQNYMTSTTP